MNKTALKIIHPIKMASSLNTKCWEKVFLDIAIVQFISMFNIGKVFTDYVDNVR